MKTSLRVLLILGPIIGIVAGVAIERNILNTTMHEMHQDETALEHADKHLDPTYVCPMHPEIIANEESSCPICGMDLVPVKQNAEPDDEDNKHPVVKVSPNIINSLGVRTIKLKRRDISRRVETPGFVQQIKQGKTTTYLSTLDGVITELLYKPGHWYEDKGEPLLTLTSETLLDAQIQHLRIFAAAPSDDKMKTDSIEDEIDMDNSNADNNSQPTASTDSLLDKDGKLTGEHRNKLMAMGHNEESIAEIEKEMQSMMPKPSVENTSEQEKQNTTNNKTVIDEPNVTENNIATNSKNMSLDDSRKRLRSLGMRDKDITQLEQSGKATDQLTLYSRAEGRVMDMRLTKGSTIKSGQKLFKLGGEVRAVVVANAFQRDAAWITTGQRVEIRMPHDRSNVWPGIVNQGAVSINPDSQNIGIRLTFAAPLDKVRSNMYVVGTIFGDTRKDVIAVPTQSIIRTEGEDRVVKALGNGRFKPVTVKIGAEAGNLTEIIEGLEEGDEVVVMAHFLIDSESSLQASLQRLNSL